jgi:phosphate starvation-inducible PhoH-like protein
MYKDLQMPTKPRSRSANGAAANCLPVLPELRQTRHQAKAFKPMNEAQESYVSKINNHTLTFCVGPAGTGKTFCAAMAAAEAFKSRTVDRIVITRPIVEAGEQIGFLPGDMNEKVGPYVAPFVDALKRVMGSGQVEALVEHGKIEFLPLAFMRGHSLDNTFLVLDEAQNVTKAQMKLFLTRIGKNTKVIVDGDITQKDIDVHGLDDAIERLVRVKGVALQRFTEADIVRSGIVRDIIKAYSSDFFYEATDDEDEEGLNRFLSNAGKCD